MAIPPSYDPRGTEVDSQLARLRARRRQPRARSTACSGSLLASGSRGGVRIAGGVALTLARDRTLGSAAALPLPESQPGARAAGPRYEEDVEKRSGGLQYLRARHGNDRRCAVGSGGGAPTCRGARAALPGSGGSLDRADRRPSGPLASDGQSATSTTRPARRRGRSRPATSACAAAAARTRSRATARATPTRTATAPRGALSYPRRSREELEGMFLGPMAYPDPKGERNNRMSEKRRSCQVSGVRRRGTRVIWRRLDCLKPNLQRMKRRIRRKDACYRRHALRWHSCRVIATFGAWSVAQ